MKKIFLSILLLICLTGCTATYDLNINSNGLTEKLTVKATSLSENEGIFNYYLPLYYYDSGSSDTNEKIEGVEYYDSNLLTENSLNKLTYKHTFKPENYIDSTIINSCFDYKSFSSFDYDENGENDYIKLTNSSDFNCFETYENLENVVVNITVNYDVIDNNADSVKGNTYTWNINPNKLDAIYLVYNPNKEQYTWIEGIFKNSTFLYFAIIISAALLGFIIFFILKKYSDSKNKLPD